MQSFKRQIFKFGLIEERENQAPTVDSNSDKVETNIFQFTVNHFTNNFQDPDGDSYEITRIRTLPAIGVIKNNEVPVVGGSIINLDNISNLTYEVPGNYMVTDTSFCEFDEDITTIIDNHESDGFELRYLGEGQIEFEKTVTSTLPNDTEVYAFIDTTTITPEDAQVLKQTLQEWFSLYKNDNPQFNGNLYFIPIFYERWLDYQDIIVKGTGYGKVNKSRELTVRGGNAAKEHPNTPSYNWNTHIGVYPPNFDHTTDNPVNNNWTAPENVMVLSFINEANPEYHRERQGYGFEGQPTQEYLEDYKRFLDNYNDNFNFFSGVFYPIPNLTQNNYNNTSNALVLQGFAAIEGGPNYTLEQIEDLGVAYAREREFERHLNVYHPRYTGLNVTVANPYSSARKVTIPDTEYELKGLKAYGWKGVYNKQQPAIDVFSSDSFSMDLTQHTVGEIPISIENKVIFGTCVEGTEDCFSFQTSDDSPQKLYSNVATFCLTDFNESDLVQTATPPEVEGMVRPYMSGQYQFVIGDFTNEFYDRDGDSYENIKIETLFRTSRGTIVEGFKNSGNEIRNSITINHNNVSNLTFNLPQSHYVINSRLYRFNNNLTTLINNLENQGYTLFENQRGELTYTRLNTSDPITPTVESQTIKGNDIGSNNISLTFKVSDDSPYELYSDTATFTFEMRDSNTTPIVEGWSDVVSVNEFRFSEEMFTNNFTGQPNSVRLENIIETNSGTLTYKGYDIDAPIAISIDEIDELVFEVSDRFVFQNGKVYSFNDSINDIIYQQESEGYTLGTNENGIMTFEKIENGQIHYRYIPGNTVKLIQECINFRTSDSKEVPLFSNNAQLCLTIPGEETPIEFNQPPVVGDNIIEL